MSNMNEKDYRKAFESMQNTVPSMPSKKKIAAALVISSLVVLAVGMQIGFHYHKTLYEDVAISDGGGTTEETFYIAGYLYVEYKRGDGDWILHHYGSNVLCNVGKNYTRHLIADQTWVNNNATTNAMRMINIGEGNGGGASSTNLTTYFDGQIGTFALVKSTNNYTLTYTWSAGAFGGETIQESGISDIDLFNAAAVIFNYQDFTGITLQATDSLQITWEVQIGT